MIRPPDPKMTDPLPRHTSAVPDQPRPLGGVAPVVLDPHDWATLHGLAVRYGASEIVRVLRLHQMIEILKSGDKEPSGESEPRDD